ncbi:MAG: NfeD family protein [Leptolyngbyaceae bacterium]|nr:NfeD family protein [Leptolyngbyaceae bacterium]
MPVDTTVLIWLVAGIILCILEFTVPTAFVEFTMGISAMIVAFVSIVMPNVGLQIALWMFLSVIFTLASRRFVPPSGPSSIEYAKEAKTLTEIVPGEGGRVLYEGGSWQARCGDQKMAIAPDQTVLVIARKGNTLIVMPDTLE